MYELMYDLIHNPLFDMLMVILIWIGTVKVFTWIMVIFNITINPGFWFWFISIIIVSIIFWIFGFISLIIFG